MLVALKYLIIYNKKGANMATLAPLISLILAVLNYILDNKIIPSPSWKWGDLFENIKIYTFSVKNTKRYYSNL